MTSKKTVTVLDSWSSIGEKTVFVLDRGPYFTQVSSGHLIDGDCIKDSKKTAHLYANQSTIEPFDRSLWTCTIEAVVGYSRLVWDLFTPDQRCISILAVASDNSKPKSSQATPEPTYVERICTWQDTDQNLDYLMKALARTSHSHQVCPPNKLKTTKDIAKFPNCEAGSLEIINSLDQALSELSQLTSFQTERKYAEKLKFLTPKVDNNGRIILISSFQDSQSIERLIDEFETLLKNKNENLKSLTTNTTSSNFSPINYCDLVIVNTFPIFDEGPCSQIKYSSSFRPQLHCKTYSVKSGRIIAGLLNNLCLQHHNLRSTTITGIPMKEEQNNSSSSQYDVEIVHCSSIHEDIMNSGSPLFEGVVEQIDRNGFPCDTFKLNWCTPRSTTIELNHCVATSRITAVDINSRPSACLTNFLLNGRAVMLEIFKSKSNRMTTHILASHNGELYIHSLATMQHKLNLSDPPAISDHLGGKVSDYRLNDFVAFMKQHTLIRSNFTEEPLKKTMDIIKRQTLYWPLTIGHTILINVPTLVGKILQLVPKDSLNQLEVDECKKAIDAIIKSEHDGSALPSVSILDVVKNVSTKSGATKLEQLYKLLWNEIEYFVRVHNSSPEHEAILEYLLERCGDKKAEGERGTKRASTSKTNAMQAKRAKTSTQLIPEISDNSASIQQTAMYYKTGRSLWQTWTQLYNKFHQTKKKLPIIGRLHQQATSDAPAAPTG